MQRQSISTKRLQHAGEKKSGYTFLAPLIALFLVWTILITQTRYHWGGESYYNFGWFVPFLAMWLLVKSLSQITPSTPAKLRYHFLISALCILCAIPFHALSEVNPFWRLPLWIQAFFYFSFSLTQIPMLLGWPGVRRAVFPLFFLTTMIPWPFRFEVVMVQFLTKVVVFFAMHGLHFLGYPVELTGNSFVLGDMNIGVNEACSGIRSFQALFMVTLFLGSLFGQGWKRRLAAVLILPMIVIAVNSARAVFLALQAIENGSSAYEDWHDPAGYIAFGVSMVLIYAFIELFNVGARESKPSHETHVSFLRDALARFRAPGLVFALPALPVFLFASVEGWFRYNEMRFTSSDAWDLVIPSVSTSTIKVSDFEDYSKTLLGFDYGKHFVKSLPGRGSCIVYYYGYSKSNMIASVSSYYHSPTVCMKSGGAFLDEQFPDLAFQIEGGPVLDLKHYTFKGGRLQGKMHIFWTNWERRHTDLSPSDGWSFTYKSYWNRLLKGRRDSRRQVLLLGLTEIKDPEEARSVVRDLLSDWLVAKPD